MLAFLTLVIGVALPVGALFLLLRRGKRQLDAAVAYRQVASELGLGVDTRGVSVHGYVDARRLWVGEVLVGHGVDRRIAIWGVLDLQRPLGLGLQIRRRGLSERVFRRGRAPGVELGDAFDRHVELRGDSSSRVRALIGDPTVKARLHQLMSRWPDVVVTDASVRVHLRRHETREQDLMDLVSGMKALSDALAEARRAVEPPDKLQRLLPRFEALAERTGLEVEPWLPALSGEIEGRACAVVIARVDAGYRAEVRARLLPHKPTGLRIGEQEGPDGYWSVGQDIQVGDSEFDRAFVLKGWDPDKTRTRLDADVRRTLLELHRLGTPQVDDERIVVQDLALDETRIEQALHHAVTLAGQLKW